MSESVLVTGAAGFIGSHLCRSMLERGERVVGVDNFDAFYDRSAKEANLAALPSRGFTFVEADILDGERMRALHAEHTPATVFHIAALAGVRPSIADPARYATVNVDGLITMLEAARASDCRRFVFASSSSVYGNNRNVPFAETDEVAEPISPYAATKRAGELICHTYSHLFGMAIASLRFFTVYGPAQRPDLAISRFMRLIADGDDVPMFGDGTTSRDYTYIDDIIAGVLAARDRVQEAGDGFNRIYNLGGSQPVELHDMIEQIAAVVGRPAKIKPLPMQPGDVDRTFADLTRSRDELGYQPRTSFVDGLNDQWQWLRDRL
jgi:UDP-glucuronate 4-epimerase